MTKTIQNKASIFLIVLLSSMGCAEDISVVDDAGTDATVDEDAEMRPDLEDDAMVSDEAAVTSDLGGGLYETFVSANSTTDWVLYDFESGTQVLGLTDPWDEPGWDLALQRYQFRLNGGASGAGGVAALLQEDVQITDVTQAISGEYQTDAEDGDDADEIPECYMSADNYEESRWWNYDGNTHQLSARERVYFLRTEEGNYFAVQVVDYYNPSTGSGGYPAFQWKQVEPPAE